MHYIKSNKINKIKYYWKWNIRFNLKFKKLIKIFNLINLFLNWIKLIIIFSIKKKKVCLKKSCIISNNLIIVWYHKKHTERNGKRTIKNLIRIKKWYKYNN